MSIARGAAQHPMLNLKQSVAFFEDFLYYSSGGLFTSVTTTGVTVAADTTAFNTSVGAGDNVLTSCSSVTQNSGGIFMTQAPFLPIAANPAMYAESHLKYASAGAANSARIFFGFASTAVLPAQSNVDPTASFSGAIIYRLDGDTNFRAMVSNGSTKTVKTSANGPCADGEHILRVDISPFDSANFLATFRVDNVVLKDSNGIQISVTGAYTSLAAMGILALTQNATTNAPTSFYADYVAGGKYRSLLGN